MNILKYSQFNEKLEIKPVSRERLLNTKKNDYNTIALGGLLWRTKNETSLVGADGNPLKEGVYDNDKQEFLDFGDYIITQIDNTIYYTFPGALKLVPKGWRIPTTEDFEKIMKYGKHLISKDNKCTDKYGFDAKLLGFSRRPFVNGFDSCASFWCVDDKNPQKAKCFMITKKDKPYCKISDVKDKHYIGMSVRLCKDL